MAAGGLKRRSFCSWLPRFYVSLLVSGALLALMHDIVEAVRCGPGGTKTAVVRTAVARRVAPFRISAIERALPPVSRELIRSVLKGL